LLVNSDHSLARSHNSAVDVTDQLAVLPLCPKRAGDQAKQSQLWIVADVSIELASRGILSMRTQLHAWSWPTTPNCFIRLSIDDDDHHLDPFDASSAT